MKRFLTALLCLYLTGVTYADNKRQLLMKKCALNYIGSNYSIKSKNASHVLIEVDKSQLQSIVHALHVKRDCGRFFDVSFDYKKEAPSKILGKYTLFPKQLKKSKYRLSHTAEVNKLIAESSPDNMWNQLKHLTEFYNRYADGKYGVEAINWVKSEFDRIATENNRTDVASYFVETRSPRYKQSSLVTVIGKDIQADAVVVGAHIDTYSGYKQGADDDGTGSATNLELARLLLQSKMTFKHPIYIIWYSAEEWGLIGSQHVVRDFRSKNIPVKAVMQIDMSGYNSSNNNIYIVRDYTDDALSLFTEKLIEQYTDTNYDEMECYYACSDHASWMKAGIPAVMPFEADLYDGASPYIHTSSDILDTVSKAHMTQFLKLAIGFVGELADAELPKE